MPGRAHTRAVASTDPLPRRVLIVAYPGIQSLDAVGPFEVFTGASDVVAGRRRASTPVYDVHLVSRAGGSVRAESGLPLGTEPLPDPDQPIDTLLIAGGFGVQEARHGPSVSWCRSASCATRPRGCSTSSTTRCRRAS